MDDLLAPALFEPHLDSTFLIEDAATELTLADVTRMPPHSMRAEPFVLAFLGPPTPVLPQGIYHLQHQSLGELDIFIVPIAADAAGARYEAVFN